MFIASTAVDKCKMDSEARKDSRLKRHRVKYRLDYFLDHFKRGGGKRTISAGCTLSVLREGWEAECYYSGRGERRTITTQGGVGGGCNSKHCRLMELLLDRTNYFTWFFD